MICWPVGFLPDIGSGPCVCVCCGETGVQYRLVDGVDPAAIRMDQIHDRLTIDEGSQFVDRHQRERMVTPEMPGAPYTWVKAVVAPST